MAKTSIKKLHKEMTRTVLLADQTIGSNLSIVLYIIHCGLY